MKIVDCFPYFNEKELLELRIKLLYDKVDKFIITDANKTHRGTPKNFSCKNTLQEIGLLGEKIKIIEVDLPSYEEEPNPWVRERMQRNAATVHIEDDDICIVSDCDEIINPEYVHYYASVVNRYPNNILRIPLVNLTARADLRAYDTYNNPIVSRGSFFCKKHHLKKYTLSDIRESSTMYKHFVEFTDICITENNVIEEVGWHFGWMGDADRMKTKISSFLHWNDGITLKENYIPKEDENDPLGRQMIVLKKYPVELLPNKIFEIEHVKNFLLPTKKISLVQIGTNNTDDELNKYINDFGYEFDLAIFVEPNSKCNNDIIKNYSLHKNFHIENVAISPTSPPLFNTIKIYHHTGDNNAATASIKIEHLVKHAKFYSTGEVKTFEVPLISLKQLLDKYNVKKLDWLLIDAEGIDGDIILSFDWKDYDIKRVEFEHIHLGDKKEQIEKMFFQMNYKKVNSLHEFNWAFEK